MKFNIELDITPEELKEVFEGNTQVIQQALMNVFLNNVSKAGTPSTSVMQFWEGMAKNSTAMFEEYQKMMSGKAKEND